MAEELKDEIVEAVEEFEEDGHKGMFMTFQTGKEYYGISISYVNEIITMQPITAEPWNVLTVNLNSIRPQNCAFIDTNNNGEDILAWIIRHGLAVPTGTYGRSGFCNYPEYRFRPEILQEIDPDGYASYLHDWKERYAE